MEGDCRKALDSLSVTTLRSVRQRVAGLSGGQWQAVAVAKSVMRDSKLVILDEYPPQPSASPRTRRCSISFGASPSRAWRRRHLAQPARHLRGLGLDHGAEVGLDAVRSSSGARRASRRWCTRMAGTPSIAWMADAEAVEA